MQETQAQSLVQEDSTCLRATKSMHHNYWKSSLEPVLRIRRNHCYEKPSHGNQRMPSCISEDPAQPWINKYIHLYKSTLKVGKCITALKLGGGGKQGKGEADGLTETPSSSWVASRKRSEFSPNNRFKEKLPFEDKGESFQSRCEDEPCMWRAEHLWNRSQSSFGKIQKNCWLLPMLVHFPLKKGLCNGLRALLAERNFDNLRRENAGCKMFGKKIFLFPIFQIGYLAETQVDSGPLWTKYHPQGVVTEHKFRCLMNSEAKQKHWSLQQRTVYCRANQGKQVACAQKPWTPSRFLRNF